MGEPMDRPVGADMPNILQLVRGYIVNIELTDFYESAIANGYLGVSSTGQALEWDRDKKIQPLFINSEEGKAYWIYFLSEMFGWTALEDLLRFLSTIDIHSTETKNILIGFLRAIKTSGIGEDVLVPLMGYALQAYDFPNIEVCADNDDGDIAIFIDQPELGVMIIISANVNAEETTYSVYGKTVYHIGIIYKPEGQWELSEPKLLVERDEL